MSVLKVGNTIRHRKPYWGEPAYYVREVAFCGARGIPTGSKHGRGWDRGETCCVIYHESEKHYKICPIYTRAWLWLLGNAAALLK